MICPTCRDSGLRGHVLHEVYPDGAKVWRPCLACGGCGFQHCCEGDQEQPEPAEED
jgi:hypothetical protein